MTIYFSFVVAGVTHITDGSDNGYESLMLSLKDAKEIVFGLHACRDGHIALSKVPGILEFHTYELIIGAQNNMKTILRSSIGGASVSEVDSPQILNCTEVRMFWIAWRSAGEIAFGKGSAPLQGRLLYYQDPNPYRLTALSVATPQGVMGVWKVYHFTGMSLYKLVVF